MFVKPGKSWRSKSGRRGTTEVSTHAPTGTEDSGVQRSHHGQHYHRSLTVTLQNLTGHRKQQPGDGSPESVKMHLINRTNFASRSRPPVEPRNDSFAFQPLLYRESQRKMGDWMPNAVDQVEYTCLELLS